MTAAHPLFRLTVDCFLPKTLTLGEVELPARTFNHTSGYRVGADQLVFDDVPDERSVKALVGLIEASRIGRCREKPVFTVETLLYSATQRRWTDKALASLSPNERRRNRRRATKLLFFRLNGKALLKALGENVTRKQATRWERAAEFFLGVSYSAKLAMDVADAEIHKAIGRASYGSGMGFGQRDLTFSFTQAEALRAALKRLSKVATPVNVSLGRNFYNGRGEFEDANEICQKLPPQKAILLLA